MLKIPQTKAELKRLPIGTKLVLINCLTGACNKIRTIKEIKSKEIVMDTGKGNSYLPLNGKFFYTENTFGLKKDNTILAEYKFVEDQKC